MPIVLNHAGRKIFNRGGDKRFDNVDPVEADDSLLIFEIMGRAPNMDPADYEEVFIALRLEYGEDALDAVRSGHVQFRCVSSRDMQQPKETES